MEVASASAGEASNPPAANRRSLHHHPRPAASLFPPDGLDILLDLPISMYEALLGTKVEVPTLEGPVTLTIPQAPPRRQAPHQSPRHRARQRPRRPVRPAPLIAPRGLDDEDRKTIQDLEKKHPLNPRADSTVVAIRGTGFQPVSLFLSNHHGLKTRATSW
jgi:hypothetical protein